MIDKRTKEFLDLLTFQEKLKRWGQGPWVDEPNYLEFVSHGFECEIRRVAAYDGPREAPRLFGGHLVGYIHVEKGHPWYGQEDVYDAECHFGVTYSRPEGDKWKIGFDCGHGNDIVPSVERYLKILREQDEVYRKLAEEMDDFRKKYPESFGLFHKEYRSFDFVKNQLEELAKQAQSLVTKTLS